MSIYFLYKLQKKFMVLFISQIMKDCLMGGSKVAGLYQLDQDRLFSNSQALNTIINCPAEISS